MSLVSRPFILDFAGATLDVPSNQWPDKIMRRHRAEKQRQFGSRWPKVQEVVREFRKMGIYLSDVKPGNIEFGDDE